MADEHKDNHASGDAHGDGHASGGHGSGGHGGGHGGGGHAEGEHEGAPEWLISFADNVALMMGFFVILLAMNMQKPQTGGIGGEGKNPSDEENPAMQDFAIAVRKAFNTPVDINSTDPNEASLVKRLRERERQGDATDPGPDGANHNVQAVRPTDFVNIAGFVSFPDNSAVLTDPARRTMAEVAEKLRGLTWIVEVRGHVSAAEAARDKDRAMRLSGDRALAGAKALVAEGVQWEQIRVVACADNERVTPLARGTEGHQNNQRAEVVITQEQMPRDPYSGGGAADPQP